MLETYMLITFDDVHEAMKAQKITIPARIVPTPAKVDSKCGMSLKLAIDDLENVLSSLKQANIQYARLFKVQKEGLNYEYIKQS